MPVKKCLKCFQLQTFSNCGRCLLWLDFLAASTRNETRKNKRFYFASLQVPSQLLRNIVVSSDRLSESFGVSDSTEVFPLKRAASSSEESTKDLKEKIATRQKIAKSLTTLAKKVFLQNVSDSSLELETDHIVLKVVLIFLKKLFLWEFD